MKEKKVNIIQTSSPPTLLTISDHRRTVMPRQSQGPCPHNDSDLRAYEAEKNASSQLFFFRLPITFQIRHDKRNRKKPIRWSRSAGERCAFITLHTVSLQRFFLLHFLLRLKPTASAFLLGSNVMWRRALTAEGQRLDWFTDSDKMKNVFFK